MKSRSVFVFGAALIGLVACGNISNNLDSDGQSAQVFLAGFQSSDEASMDEEGLMKASSGQNEIVFHKVIDPKTNTPFCEIPLPARWKITNGKGPEGASIVGPNGIMVHDYQYQSFIYSNDPYTAQMYQAAGQSMRQPISPEEVIKQDIGSAAGANGLKLLGIFPLPQVAQNDMNYDRMLFKVGNDNKQISAMGAEWLAADGKKVLMVLHYSNSYSMGLGMWGYYVSTLTAPAAEFDQAKKHYINGISNIRYNMEPINQYNQQEQARYQNSDAQFQARMRSNQDNFNATQETYRRNNEATNAAIMGTYYSSSESFNRSNQMISNGILEENTVTHSNGNQYQVEAGANHYWMNSDGQYIPSNSEFFNPNTDPNYNHQTWEKVEIQK